MPTVGFPPAFDENVAMDFRTAIKNEIERRVQSNARYSLRAFARSVGVDPGNLSRVLSGKSNLSRQGASRIAPVIGLGPVEQLQFVEAATGQLNKNNSRNKDIALDRSGKAGGCGETGHAEIESQALELETFRIISSLYQIALIELTYLPDFQPNPQWIAKRLGVSHIEAKLAWERLIRTGVIEFKNKKWRKSTDDVLKTPGGTATSGAMRKYQKEVLHAAGQAVDNVSIERRVHAAMAFPMSESKVDLARDLIERFMVQLTHKLRSRKDGDEVYQLGISLFPITKRSS